jgi:hypothetical protein
MPIDSSKILCEENLLSLSAKAGNRNSVNLLTISDFFLYVVKSLKVK